MSDLTEYPAAANRDTDDDPRSIAYETVHAVSRDDAYANLVLPKLLSYHGLSERDAAFATELAYGTLRMRGTLDKVIAAVARREITKIDTAVLDVLRLGAYQLLCTRVAIHAAVDTTVSLARNVCGHKPAGFVNAVMRKVSQRNSAGWLDNLETGDYWTDLATEYAHPPWIAKALAAALNEPDELPLALGANNEPPKVHLCARPSRMSQSELAIECAGQPGEWSPHAVYLPSGAPGDLPSIRRGSSHVQDEGSQLVADAVTNVELDGADETWLDLCAGPGGKAALLAGVAAQRGAHVTAVEVSEHRAALVEQTTRGLPVSVVHGDGREFRGSAAFDRVLVDAPCSGLGALRRRPEARWRRSANDLPNLIALQEQLLSAALDLVRPGGIVAYVTCSPMLSETREIVSGVAQQASVVDARPYFPAGLAEMHDPMVQLWPHRHGTDAMFCALLRRH